MAVNVGDAILTFIGDTQQLDAAFDKVNTDAVAKLEPAREAAAGVGDALGAAGAQGEAAAMQLAAAETQAQEALQGVAAAAERNRQAQEALQQATNAVKESGEGNAEAMIALAQAQQRAAQTATELAAAEKAAQTDSAAASGAAVAGAVEVNAAFSSMAQATIKNEAAQAELHAAMKAVKSAGAEDSAAVAALAQAQQKAAVAAAELAAAEKLVQGELRKIAPAVAEADEGFDMHKAKGELAFISEETGVGIPKHLRGFVAELPGVGAALQAAFAATAVLMLVQILMEGYEKLKEWMEAGEKLHQAWVQLEYTHHNTAVGIQADIDNEKAKFIELTEGPIAAMEFKLQHMGTTADQVFDKLAEDVQKSAENMKSQSHWWDFFSGGPSISKVSKEVTEMWSGVREAMNNAEKSAPGNAFAPYDVALQALDRDIEETTTKLQGLEAANKEAVASFATAKNGVADIADLGPLKQQIELLTWLRGQMDKGRELEKQRQESAEADEKSKEQQHELEVGTARINAYKTWTSAKLAYELEVARQSYEHGQVSYAQLLDAERSNANQRYQIEKSGLEQRLGLLDADPTKNESSIKEINGQLQALEFTHKAELLKIDGDAYKKQAADGVAAWEQLIAQSKQGSEERINLEVSLGTYLAKMWGEQSDAYKQQLVKISEARRAHTEELRRLAQQEVQNDNALASDRLQANQQYYQYMVQTARMSAVAAQQIQRQEQEAEYQRKKNMLQKQLDELGKDEVVARKGINGQLDLLDQQHEENRRVWALQTEDELEQCLQYFGIKSKETYERQEQVAEEMYFAIAGNARATYDELMDAERKLLQATIERKEAAGEDAEPERKALENLTNSLHKLDIAQGKVRTGGSLMRTLFRQLGIDVQLMGTKISNVSLMVAGAAAAMAMAWSQGGATAAEAARRMAAGILQAVAQYAFTKMIEQLALGFAAMSPISPDFGHSAEHFTSAALWGAAGAGASVAAGMINNAGGKDEGAAGEVSVSTGVTQGATAAPTTGANIPRFATGALFSGPTVAVLGDALGNPSNSQGQQEAAVPLDNPDAMESIGKALGPHLGSGQAPIQVFVEGVISADNLTQVVKKLNHAVRNNDLTLLASNAYRVTKKA